MNISFLNNKNFIKKENFINSPFLTESISTTELESYKKIQKILLSLINNGTIRLMDGYCLSASETIRMALKSFEIESRIYECQLSLVYYEQEPPICWFVGHESVKREDEVDTHVIVVTETDPPFLIDSSISSKLPVNKPVILDIFKDEKNQSHNIVTSYDIEQLKLKILYQSKSTPKIAKNIQTSILERINTDKKIFEQIEILKKLNYIGIGFGVFSLIAVLHQLYRWWIYG